MLCQIGNVTDFGMFVDCGLENEVLVPLSSACFPGQIVTLVVEHINLQRQHIKGRLTTSRANTTKAEHAFMRTAATSTATRSSTCFVVSLCRLI